MVLNRSNDRGRAAAACAAESSDVAGRAAPGNWSVLAARLTFLDLPSLDLSRTACEKSRRMGEVETHLPGLELLLEPEPDAASGSAGGRAPCVRQSWAAWPTGRPCVSRRHSELVSLTEVFTVKNETANEPSTWE